MNPTAWSLLNVAEALLGQGRYAQAESALRRSIDILEHTFGERHPLLGAVLGALVRRNAAQQHDTEALRLLERALRNAERGLGASHPEVANLLV